MSSESKINYLLITIYYYSICFGSIMIDVSWSLVFYDLQYIFIKYKGLHVQHGGKGLHKCAVQDPDEDLSHHEAKEKCQVK